MKLTYKIANFFEVRPPFLYVLIFVITLTLFSYLQLDPTFADPDSFYHAKMALLLADRGAITEFPWLSATNLKYNFIDHHFLYHLALVPFVKLLPPPVGLKVATVIFASLAVLIFFWLLRQLKIKGAFWYAVFLLTINPFIFRLNLAKAQPLVLFFLFLIIYLIFNRRYLSLALFSCFYVWLYGGWPLVLVLVFVYTSVNWFWVNRQGGWIALRVSLGKLKVFWQNFLLLLATVAGVLVGLFFNPYFPKNLYFYWQQTFEIAIFNYQGLIGVGGEWYPYAPQDLLLAALPFFLLLFFALAGFVVFYKKQPMNTWFFFILSVLFFGLTLKSRRYVEYFIPLAICFSALSLNAASGLWEKNLGRILPKKYILWLPWLLLLALTPVFARDLQAVRNSYSQGIAFNKFAEPMSWLKLNSQTGDIVFHGDWDEFPLLFYQNDKNYYLVGLDPTFMYKYDKVLYRRWVDFTTGQTKTDLYPIIKNIFGAKYVFVDIRQNQALGRNLADNFNFKKVFENQEAKIYRVSD